MSQCDICGRNVRGLVACDACALDEADIRADEREKMAALLRTIAHSIELGEYPVEEPPAEEAVVRTTTLRLIKGGKS